MSRPSISKIVKVFGCTEESARRQLAANAKQLRECHVKAIASGKPKYRGYTAAQWDERATAYENPEA
jgi:hypothetical protein